MHTNEQVEDHYEDMIDDTNFTRFPVEPGEKFYRIKFTKKFDSWGDKAKIEWLEKVASSQNQWAGKLQKLNDQKQALLNQKEALIVKLTTDQDRDRQMIHLQLQNENKAKQKQAARIKQLMGTVKDLMAENKKLIDETLSLHADIKRLKYGDKH